MTEETPEGAAPSYESATARLDEIIQRLDSGDAQLRETLELCEEAKTLIEYCAGELAAVDQGLKELKLEDLASSLTGAAVLNESAVPATAAESTPETEPAPDGEQTPPPSDIPF